MQPTVASPAATASKMTSARSIETLDGYVSWGQAPPSSVPKDHAMLQDFAAYLELRLKSQNLSLLRRIFADFLNEHENTLVPLMQQGSTIITVFPVLRTSRKRLEMAKSLLAKPKFPLDTRGCVFLYLQSRAATRNIALLKHLFLDFVLHSEKALLFFVDRGVQVISVIPFELPRPAQLAPVWSPPPSTVERQAVTNGTEPLEVTKKRRQVVRPKKKKRVKEQGTSVQQPAAVRSNSKPGTVVKRRQGAGTAVIANKGTAGSVPVVVSLSSTSAPRRRRKSSQTVLKPPVVKDPTTTTAKTNEKSSSPELDEKELPSTVDTSAQATSVQAPLKRGRKRKSEAEKNDEESKLQEKSGESAAVVPSTLDTSAQAASVQAPLRRGRKRKSEAKKNEEESKVQEINGESAAVVGKDLPSTVDTSAAQSTSVQASLKRGRKRKSVKKKSDDESKLLVRQNNGGSAAIVGKELPPTVDTSAAQATSVQALPRRGRKRKSEAEKNGDESKAPVQLNNGESAAVVGQELPSTVDTSAQATSVQAQLRRGRKRKSEDEKNDDESKLPEQENNGESAAVEETELPPTVDTSAAQSTGVQAAPKRGRKRKSVKKKNGDESKLPVQENNGESAAVSTAAVQPSSTEAPPKKKKCARKRNSETTKHTQDTTKVPKKKGKHPMSAEMIHRQEIMMKKLQSVEAQSPWKLVFRNVQAPFDETRYPELAGKLYAFWRTHARAVWERSFWGPMSHKTDPFRYNARNNRQLTAKNTFEAIIIAAYKELGAEFFVKLDAQRHPSWWYRGPIMALFAFQQVKGEDATWDYVKQNILERFPDCEMPLPLKSPNSGAVRNCHNSSSQSMWANKHGLAPTILREIDALKAAQQEDKQVQVTPQQVESAQATEAGLQEQQEQTSPPAQPGPVKDVMSVTDSTQAQNTGISPQPSSEPAVNVVPEMESTPNSAASTQPVPEEAVNAVTVTQAESTAVSLQTEPECAVNVIVVEQTQVQSTEVAAESKPDQVVNLVAMTEQTQVQVSEVRLQTEPEHAVNVITAMEQTQAESTEVFVSSQPEFEHVVNVAPASSEQQADSNTASTPSHTELVVSVTSALTMP